MELKISWADKHESVHGLRWLIDRQFTQESQTNHLNRVYKPPKRLWNKSSFESILTTFNYSDLINTDNGMCTKNLTYSKSNYINICRTSRMVTCISCGWCCYDKGSTN